MIGWRRVWSLLSKGAEVGEDQKWYKGVVERDMKVRDLVRSDAKDQVKWRALSWGAKG